VTNRLERAREESHTRKWGTFLTLERNTIRRDRSARENGFDSETPGFLAGLDRRLSDPLLLGVAAGFKVTDLSFDDVSRFQTVADPAQLGRQRTYTGTIGPYLSYTPNQPWYLNSSLIIGVLGASTERSGDGLTGKARGDTLGYRVSLAGGGGYDWRYRALRLGPHVNVAWDHLHLGSFSESGERADASRLLRVQSFDDDMVTLKSGGRGSYAFPFSWGALVPNARLDFVYRNLDRSGQGSAALRNGGEISFPLDRLDRTSLEMGVGLQLALTNELALWVDYEEDFLERFFDRSRVTVGARKQF